MQSENQAAPVSKKMLWAGYIVSALPVFALVMSAFMKLTKPPEFVEGMNKLGWPENLALPLAIIELSCVVIYAIPRTAVLGAILMTGYLGGATATHVRIHDDFIAPVIVGMLAWGGLWLRDRRVRALIPLRVY